MNPTTCSSSTCYTSSVLAILFVIAASNAWRLPPQSIKLDDNPLLYKNPRNVPTDLCPRDEAQAQIQGQTCLRKCSSDDDCKSKRKKCLCDGPCGMSCIKPDRECGDPEPPRELGDVRTNGKTFGSKATYFCPDGYKVVGMEERLCQADGTWSGTPPVCKKNIFCTEPPTIKHARHNAPADQKTFNLDESLQYQCMPGYVTKGFARTKCFFYNGTAKWFGPDITCEAKSCGDPRDILNGRHEGSCHYYGCNITYKCQPGFELIGQSAHYCQSDGTWTPRDLPTCVPVQCNIPENPTNGKAVFTSVSFNSQVAYECKYGYMLVGEGSRRCGPDKKWTGREPTCEEINCGSPGILFNGWVEGSRTTLHAVVAFHCLPGMTFEGSDRSVCQSDGTWSHVMPKCSEIDCGHPGELYNGWIENIERGTALGASLIFRCKQDMTLVGHTSSICQIDGKWRYPLPNCFAPCRIPSVAYGNITLPPSDEIPVTEAPDSDTAADINNGTEKKIYLPPGTIVPHGKVIAVECEGKYEPAYSVSPPTCNNGTWSYAPKCQPARCKGLPRIPKHGMVIAPKTEHGMKARYRCKDGYILVGENITECLYGEWTGETPICNQTFCKFPGSIPDGRVLLVGNMGLYDYRNYVTKVANNRQIKYECNKGFALVEGPQGKTCVRGEWSPKRDPPRCIPSQHPTFRFRRDTEVLSRPKRRAIKTGGSSVVRGSKGGGGGGSGLSSRRGKKKGYRYESDDSYEYSPLACENFDDDPYIRTEVITWGSDDNSSYVPGTIMKVSCVKGFGVNLPNETTECKNGKWKPTVPKCGALPCRTPYIPHGSFYEGTKPLFFQELIKHMKKIEFQCSKGYVLKGPSSLGCWYGEWDVSEAPKCLPIPCSLPPLDYGKYSTGYRAGMTIPHGSVVDYFCAGDFRKMINEPSRCDLGEWKPTKPFCLHSSSGHMKDYSSQKSKRDDTEEKRKSCKRPPKEPYALAYLEGKPIDFQKEYTFEDGTQIAYRCLSVRPKMKNRMRITCEDGTWNYPPAKLRISCEESELDVDEYTRQILSLINGPCLYKQEDEHIVVFHEGQRVKDAAVDFPTNTVLVARCVDIGKFRLQGAKRRECASGQWLGVTPKCEGLSQNQDYALDKPPTILFRYVNGTFLQSNDGKLLIYTGTTVHMECLWIRKFGTPKWEVSNKHRIYEEGWATGEHRNNNLEYRLTIDNAQPEDSGIYRCVTPARHGHEVEIVVKAVDCPPLPHRNDLNYSTTSTKFGTKVNFTCTDGNDVVGANEIVCLDTGNWSDPLPKCEHVECPDISLLPAMAPMGYPSLNGSHVYKNDTMPPRIIIEGRGVGDKAIFECPQGSKIVRGAPYAVCQLNAKWSEPVPLCQEMECPSPTPPENGHVTSTGPYKAGDLAHFECDQGYKMESTQMAVVACQDSGTWSRNPIKCVKACTYPGTIIGGTISKVDFFYGIGETIEFDCNANYRLQGTRMIHCLKNGKWSHAIPQCILLDQR